MLKPVQNNETITERIELLRNVSNVMKIAENRWRMETEDSYSAKPSMETFWIQYIPTTSLWDRSLRSVAFQHFIVWNSFNKHQLNTHQAYSSCFGEFKIRIWIFFLLPSKIFQASYTHFRIRLHFCSAPWFAVLILLALSIYFKPFHCCSYMHNSKSFIN